LKTVAETGERELIARMMSHFTLMPRMPVPFWDDVNAISLGNGDAVVLKTDMLVWKTDVPKGMTPYQVGRKSVVMNFSDLGSKGVQPQAFLAALGVPDSTPLDYVEDIAKGFEDGVREYDGYMIGGDTNEACDIIISGMAYGLVKEKNLVLRGTSKPGDILATTGGFGHTTAAFKILLEDYPVPDKIEDTLLNSIYMPKAQVKVGIALANEGIITSCMDSSDGLAVSLFDLQRSSGNGFKLTHVPLTNEAKKFAEFNNLNPKELALYGGEEYELIFTVKPNNFENAQKIVKSVGKELIELGVVTKDKKIIYLENNIEKQVKSGGWEHFTGLK
jgi:thiamine-monophosphate kinase